MPRGFLHAAPAAAALERLRDPQYNTPDNRQALIDELCRHRAEYMRCEEPVHEIDALLNTVALEGVDMLHRGRVQIPCLKVQWVEMPALSSACDNGFAERLLAVSVEIETLANVGDPGATGLWHTVMKKLAQLVNESRHVCKGDADSVLLQTIFERQFERCPFPGVREAFLNDLEFDALTWINVKGNVNRMYWNAVLQRWATTPGCKQALTKFVEALGAAVGQVVHDQEHHRWTDITQQANRLLQETTRMRNASQADEAREEFIRAFEGLRAKLTEKPLPAGTGPWEKLGKQLDTIRQTIAEQCGEKEAVPLMRAIVRTLAAQCPHETTRHQLLHSPLTM